MPTPPFAEMPNSEEEKVFVRTEHWTLQTRKYKQFIDLHTHTPLAHFCDCPLTDVAEMWQRCVLDFACANGIRELNITSNDVCNLSIYLSLSLLYSTLLYSTLLYSTLLYSTLLFILSHFITHPFFLLLLLSLSPLSE